MKSDYEPDYVIKYWAGDMANDGTPHFRVEGPGAPDDFLAFMLLMAIAEQLAVRFMPGTLARLVLDGMRTLYGPKPLRKVVQ